MFPVKDESLVLSRQEDGSKELLVNPCLEGERN